MTMIHSGNFSASIPDNVKDLNSTNIPVFHNNSKKVAVLKGKESYDRLTEKKIRTLILTTKNGKSVKFNDRSFNLIIDCSRKVAEHLKCNLNVNYRAISNVCFKGIVNGEYLDVLTPLEMDNEAENIKIDIVDSNFIRDDVTNMNNYAYPVYVPLSVSSEINMRSEYPEDRLLFLNFINPLSVFPDEDCSEVKINIDEDSYNNIVLNIYELQNFSVSGMSDYEEWNTFSFPEFSFFAPNMELNLIVDITTSKIDISSLEKLIKACSEHDIKLCLNTIDNVSDLMSEAYICHPIFDDFFSSIGKNKDAYDELAGKIFQRQINSLYTGENIIKHFVNIMSCMDIMTTGSSFFGMDINDDNKKKAHEYANKIIESIRSN